MSLGHPCSGNINQSFLHLCFYISLLVNYDRSTERMAKRGVVESLLLREGSLSSPKFSFFYSEGLLFSFSIFSGLIIKSSYHCLFWDSAVLEIFSFFFSRLN